MFITFEGCEGAGKTTQAFLLHQYFESIGIKSILTREPSKTKIGCQIREILLNKENKINPMTELYLFFADRFQHVDDIIMPAFKNGYSVICDRYTDSSIALQGSGRGLDKMMIKSMCRYFPVPDVTILLDIDPEIGLMRKASEMNRFEYEDLSFHRKVRSGFLKIANEEQKRFIVIDVSLYNSQKEIHEIIIKNKIWSDLT